MQAILLMAHRDIEQITELTELLGRRFEIYIHFDTKMQVSLEEKQKLEAMGAHTFQRVNVNWGGWGIAEAARVLMQEALKDPKITYMHVISGQCYPAGNIDEIYDFYEENNRIYMLAHPVIGEKKSGEPLILWQKYYYNYDKINRRTTFGKIYHRLNIAVQTLLRVDKIKKLGIDLELFEGPNWMDLPRDAVEYLLQYFDAHENVQKLFMTGFCPDEFWVQTILCNSEYKDRIVQDYHRYIKWEERYGSYPAILDERDFDEICQGDYHFMRKVDPEHSTVLKEKINQHYKQKKESCFS